MKIKIGFLCGYHGRAGITCAISNIANGLSNFFDVSFVVPSSSHYDNLLNPSIIKLECIDEHCDIYFCDLNADLEVVKRLKQAGKLIVVSIHGHRPPAKSERNYQIEEMLSLASQVHFVGITQQDSYRLPENSFFIIPNSVEAIKKSAFTNNVGVVGALSKPAKNAKQSIEVALKSNCKSIHLWFTHETFNNNRIVAHRWSNKKEDIYNSFDVMVFLSKKETFGLVVAEALSAGIPCVLSDLDAFLPFKGCRGVVLVKQEEIGEAHLHVNRLLEQKSALNKPIRDYYQKYLSSKKLNAIWQAKIHELVLDSDLQMRR